MRPTANPALKGGVTKPNVFAPLRKTYSCTQKNSRKGAKTQRKRLISGEPSRFVPVANLVRGWQRRLTPSPIFGKALSVRIRPAAVEFARIEDTRELPAGHHQTANHHLSFQHCSQSSLRDDSSLHRIGDKSLVVWM